MKDKLYILLIISLLVVLTACGEIVVIDDNSTVESQDNSNGELIVPTQPTVEPITNETNSSLKIIGQITYDRVHVNANGIGLNYRNITKEVAKQVVVKAIDNRGQVVASTTTDDNGNYSLINLPSNREVKIRVYAELAKSGRGGWSVKVVDNTNGNSNYVIEGNLVSTGNSSTRRNLHASSGWDGYRYSRTREAAPFAILGSIYQAIQKVIVADNTVIFPALTVNWSENNKAVAGSIADGHIITSNYDFNDGALYILGDANSDTDEYDNHIIIHEWGHYFESKFSRADSIGGSHSTGDKLDIRLAFGEGWGNAWSAIATDDPIYYDSLGSRQSDGWSMNIESESKYIPGFYSEASIQRILYDLYDSNNDIEGGDTLSLGFKPIYNVLVGKQKNTKAFTAIFSFVKGLKDENRAYSDKIDDILNSESISEIKDIYGNSFHNLYNDISIGSTINVCTSIENGINGGHHNMLGNHKFIRFDVNNKALYNIQMIQSSQGNSDPDFALYRVDSFKQFPEAAGERSNIEEASYTLDEGSYILDIVAWNPSEINPCFNITIN